MNPRLITFELAPTGWDGVATDGLRFEPKLLDVPVLSGGESAAARRAWWQSFHFLGPQGIDLGEFEVHEWIEGVGRGRKVGMGGWCE